MKIEELVKRKITNRDSKLKITKSENEMSYDKSKIYIAFCFKTLSFPIVLVLLLAGEIREAVYFTIGCFIVFPILHQLEKTLRDN